MDDVHDADGHALGCAGLDRALQGGKLQGSANGLGGSCTSRSRRMASDESTGSGSRVEGAPLEEGRSSSAGPAPFANGSAARSCSIVALASVNCLTVGLELRSS